MNRIVNFSPLAAEFVAQTERPPVGRVKEVGETVILAKK